MLEDKGIDRRIHIGKSSPIRGGRWESEVALAFNHRFTEGLAEDSKQWCYIGNHQRFGVVEIIDTVAIIVAIGVVAYGIAIGVDRLEGIIREGIG